MWATLTLMSALSAAPAAAGELKLSNDRITYGVFGPARAEKKFIPGDVVYLAFDIEGLTFDKEGQTKYSLSMEVNDSKGKPVFKSDAEPREMFAVLGGGTIQGYAHALIGTDTPPGEATIKVTVTDSASKKSKTLTRTFEVAEKSYGIVHVRTSYDPLGRSPAPGLGVVGQGLFLNFGVAGFERDKKTKQPRIELTMEVLDADGKPTLANKVTQKLDPNEPVPAEYTVVPLWFPIALTRAGKYTVNVTATDLVTEKTAKASYPITVLEPPK
jgi:hypothetical protein